MIFDISLILIGFVLLIIGSDKFIEGAISVAHQFKISERWIGLTLVAFGTSLPELVVTGYAASTGSSDVALSNVLGSNVANAWLALGVCAWFSISGPKKFKLNAEFWMPPLFILTLMSLLLFNPTPVFIPRMIPLIFLSVTTVFLIFFSGKDAEMPVQDVLHIQLSNWKTILFILLGLAGLLIGSKWIVDGVVNISNRFGWSQTLLGFSVVAVGTSLPEIASSVSATAKGKHGLAIANVLGSNLINLGIVYGVTCFFDPIMISDAVVPAFFAVLLSACTIPLYVYSISKKHHRTVFFLFTTAYFISLYFMLKT